MITSHKRQPAAAGFTIIEVLIVLAIAGLILLLVFEAIPILTRNGRNNQRKQDVSLILQAVSHYELNNSGGMPACDSFAHCTQAGGPLANIFPKLTYYNDSSTTLSVTATDVGIVGGATPPPVTDINKVTIINHFKCDLASTGSPTSTGAGYNDIVALYALESGSSPTSQCQEL